MFKDILVLVIVAIAVLLSVCNEASQPAIGNAGHAPLKSGLDSVSYAMGMNVGRVLRSQGFDTLNYDAMVTAIGAVLKGEEQPFKQELANRIINTYVSERAPVLAAGNLVQAENILDSLRGMPSVNEPEKGILCRVIREGSGEQPGMNQEVEVHFIGKLADGSLLEDTYVAGMPRVLEIGTAINGWNTILPMMQQGDIWEVWLHPDQAYGRSGGYGGLVPANSLLYYQIELL